MNLSIMGPGIMIKQMCSTYFQKFKLHVNKKHMLLRDNSFGVKRSYHIYLCSYLI